MIAKCKKEYVYKGPLKIIQPDTWMFVHVKEPRQYHFKYNGIVFQDMLNSNGIVDWSLWIQAYGDKPSITLISGVSIGVCQGGFYQDY